jgi:hypothetical protein
MRTLPARVNPASRPDCPVSLIMRHGQRAELRCLTYLRRLGASAVSPVIRQIDAPSVLSPVQRAGASSWRDAGPGCLTLTSLASVRMRQDTDERHHRGDVGCLPRVRAAGGVGLVRYRRPCRRPGCSSDGGPSSGGPALSGGPHRRPGVSVTGGDLYIAEVSVGVEHGRDVRVAKHMRMCPGDLDAGGLGEPVQAAVAACRSIRAPRVFSRIGPRIRAPTARSMARATAGGSGTRTTLVPLPHTSSTRWPCSSPRSAIFALVASKIRKPSRPGMATSAKSHGLADSRAAVSRASNCRCVKAQGR